MNKWPDGVAALAQDSDGEIMVSKGDYGISPYVSGTYPQIHAWRDGWEPFSEPFVFPEASNARTAIVTREMWEAAQK